MTDFRVGDRVRMTDKYFGSRPYLVGTAGTVLEVGDDLGIRHKVVFDGREFAWVSSEMIEPFVEQAVTGVLAPKAASGAVLSSDLVIFSAEVLKVLKNMPSGKTSYGEFYVDSVQIHFDGEPSGIQIVNQDEDYLVETV